MTLLHATCVAIKGTGIVIRGASGSGKSDLALRLIDDGADLVCDDYCEVTAEAGRLIAAVPEAIAGKIEVRGYGIVDLAHIPKAPVGLVADLLPEAEIERMPDEPVTVIEGITLPRLFVSAFAASAPAKIRAILRHVARAPS
jgi:HPr kinase/phosphorylase